MGRQDFANASQDPLYPKAPDSETIRRREVGLCLAAAMGWSRYVLRDHWCLVQACGSSQVYGAGLRVYAGQPRWKDPAPPSLSGRDRRSHSSIDEEGIKVSR